MKSNHQSPAPLGISTTLIESPYLSPPKKVKQNIDLEVDVKNPPQTLFVLTEKQISEQADISMRTATADG